MATTFTSEHFRHVMGHVPTGVSVIAGTTPTGPAGFAAGTFMSVSLDPPLVGFLVARTSTSWPKIEPLGQFAVSVLAEHDIAASRAFALTGGDKFAGRAWHHSAAGQPVLDDALAWFDCRVHRTVDAGDHLFVLGEVIDLSVRSGGRPLVFCHGTYKRLTTR